MSAEERFKAIRDAARAATRPLTDNCGVNRLKVACADAASDVWTDALSEVEAERDALRAALALAGEIGRAWRGDWSDFDGRTLRAEMDELSKIADGSETPEQYRAMNGLCPLGGGHWVDYCGDYDCKERAAASGASSDGTET